MMVAQGFTTDAQSVYPMRAFVTAAVLIAYRRSFTELRWSVSWSANASSWTRGFRCLDALEPLRGPISPSPSPLVGLSGALAASWVVMRLFGSIVVVPLAEELAFRGYLARRLISADFRTVPVGTFTLTSFVVSSFLFGALHGRWFAGVVAGMAYYLAARRRGELSDAVLAHAVTNALLAAYILATRSWSYWN